MKIIFLGPHLQNVVDYLEYSKRALNASYILLHHAPSILSLKHSLIPVMFPPCKDPLLQRDNTDSNCMYSPNRLAKVVWGPLQNEAPALFRFIQHFSLSYTEYTGLLKIYITEVASTRPVDYDDIACSWLKQNKTGNKIETIYEHKLYNLPLQGKPELYIGGIFPITGNKYAAPELAKGIQISKLLHCAHISFQLPRWP